ncbi:MAG: sulfotransferase [Kiloniellales bacterium]|nr:sulfotransferase [Kiloniellales bacterium]
MTPPPPTAAEAGKQADDEKRFAEARGLLRAGRFEEAARICKRLLKRHPGQPAILELGGLIALQRGQHREAVALLRAAIAAGQPEAGFYNNLSLALAGAGLREEAVEAARQACAANPKLAEFQVNLGNRLRAAGRASAAIDAYRRAVGLRPDLATAHVSLGNAYAAVGSGAESRRAYRAALALQPDHAKAFYHLALSSKSGKAAVDRAVEQRFRDRAAGHRLTGPEAVLIHNALGFLADLEGAHDRAFAHFSRSNETAKAESLARGKAYDPKRHRDSVDRIIRAFSAERFGREHQGASTSSRPIFVLGMPRSGTTLVERILGAHHAVSAGGELTALDDLAAGLRGYPEGFWKLPGKTLEAAAAGYLAELDRVGGAQSAFVTDKMPQNFRHIGLIAALFPAARIVHCRRDAMDTCLSCYFQNFAQGNAFAQDLADIGAYYQDYRRLMDHWRTIPALDIVEVDYEALAADPAGATRRLLAELGLAWDDACLSHHSAPGTVATASQWQVRQKVHGRSVGRWRAYRAHLEPLRVALGPFAE